METTLMMRAAKMAVQKKSSIVNWMGVNVLTHAVSHNMAALMTIVKRPKVRIVTGNDKNFTMGLTKALTTPKIRPMNRYANAVLMVFAVPSGPATLLLTIDVAAMCMPGRIQVASHRARAFIITRTTNRRMCSSFHSLGIKSLPSWHRHKLET